MNLPIGSVSWGNGSLSAVGELLRGWGASRTALFTTPFHHADAALTASVTAAVPTLRVTHSSFAAHAPEADIAAAAAILTENDIDSVVSLGGGSVIDAAKAALGRVIDAGRPRPRHVVVPTTLSGSELSHTFGITESHGSSTFKRSHARADVAADAVVYDERVVESTPSDLWLSSGVKAVDHAIEGLLGTGALPLVDSLAFSGIRRMVESLSAEPDRRGPAQIAAWECYSHPQAMRYGLSHRLGHVLGGTFGVPHSVTSAITLPAVLTRMTPTHPHVLASIAQALDVSEATPTRRFGSTCDPAQAPVLLRTWCESLGLPTRLREVGFTQRDLDPLADLTADAYPSETAVLGTDPGRRLRELVRSMW
ncbi:iron-containing alcohol dehydrogenase [Nocardioides sp. LS1]|uniref:iron-containing alcohol dehydrogenase n=1 Tax=Nocardioides sp. LS1 TaxID=1027620 RepID=UPI00163AFE79|nr:iron-containing alcohol dehydrogenase [Nocardioides sp. LS1]